MAGESDKVRDRWVGERVGRERQTDRQTETDREREGWPVGGAYNSVFSKSRHNLTGECMCRRLTKKERKKDRYMTTCPLPEDDNAGSSDKKRLSATNPPPPPPPARRDWLFKLV